LQRYNLFWDKTIKTEENGTWYRKVRQKLKKTPKGVNFSDFICIFAMSFSILLFFSNTRISEFTDVAIF